MLLTFGVRVGVALSRPPRRDADIHVLVGVDAAKGLERAGTEARLIACQMAVAHPRVVMPVSADVIAWDIETGGGYEW